MKKSKIVAVIIMLLAVCALACACRGASAYEIAVKNGFNGTEAQWLESLKGANGLNGKDGADYKGAYDAYDLYLSAVENGEFSGTFSDFITQYFAESETGASVNIARSLYSSCRILCVTPTASGSVATSAGSGVVYSVDKETGDAYIITNFHVVYSASATTENRIVGSITAYLYGSEMRDDAISCTFVGGSANYDIALLKVSGSSKIKESSAQKVTFGDSEDLTVGETVYAIGNAEGEGISVTKGVLGVDSETITLSSEAVTGGKFNIRVFRYDAAVSPGNSGGGVFDASGKLIGLCNSKTTADKSEGMGYAIPSNVIERVVDKIVKQCDGKDNEKIFKPMLGVTVESTSAKGVYNAEKARIDIVSDVFISSVNKDSPVGDVVKVGDRIVSYTFGGKKKTVTRHFQLVDELLGAYVGDKITLELERNSEIVNVPITITEEMMTMIV